MRHRTQAGIADGAPANGTRGTRESSLTGNRSSLSVLFLTLVGLSLLVVTWAGYPLVVAVIARFIGPTPRTVPPSGGTSVTAVLATREPSPVIAARVADLLSAAYPPDRLDVVVALDSGRERESGAPWSPPPRCQVVAGDQPAGKATALNAAVRAATGEILVFADAAQRFAPDTIARLVAELESRPEVTVVSGALHIAANAPPSLVTRYWSYERWLRRVESAVHSPAGVTGAVYAMRRAAWVPLPDRLILDDLFVPMQQVLRGKRIAFREDAIAYDPRQFAGSGEYRRKSRTLTGVYQLCHLLPQVLSPARNPIWAQFVCHKLLRLGTPFYVLLLVIGVAGLVAARVPTTWLLGTLGLVTALGTLGLAASVRARRAVAELLAVQGAVLRAARNAMRGEWDVW